MASQEFFFVTVRRILPSGGKDLAHPLKKMIHASDVIQITPNIKRGGSVLKTKKGNFEIYETVSEFNTAQDPASTNGAVDAILNLAGNASTISSTTVISKYYNLFGGTLTAGSADAARAPAVAGAKTFIVGNPNATVTLEFFPNAGGEAFVGKDGVQLADGAAVNIPPGETWHFVSDGTVTRIAADA